MIGSDCIDCMLCTGARSMPIQPVPSTLHWCLQSFGRFSTDVKSCPIGNCSHTLSAQISTDNSTISLHVLVDVFTANLLWLN